MNLKKTWNKKYGKSEIITKENSTLKNVEIDMVRLADGQTKAYDEKDTEFGIVIFGGKCKISGDGFDFGEIGRERTYLTDLVPVYMYPKIQNSVLRAWARYECVLPNHRLGMYTSPFL